MNRKRQNWLTTFCVKLLGIHICNYVQYAMFKKLYGATGIVNIDMINKR